MEQDLIQMQMLCDEWADILKIGSYTFTVQETEANQDDMITDASARTAVIRLGKKTDTPYDIEKRIVMGILSLWVRDYIKCKLDLHNSHMWIIPKDSIECIADVLLRLYK